MSTLVFLSCVVTKATQRNLYWKTKAKEAAWKQPSQWICFSVYPKTDDKQQGACTNAAKDFSSLDPSTLVYHPCYLLFSALGTRFPSSFSAKIKSI